MSAPESPLRPWRWLFEAPAPLLSTVFCTLFVLLIASFYFLPDQAGRNVLLYLTALCAHGFLHSRHSRSLMFGRAGGRVVLLLVLLPALSLAWSSGVTLELSKDLLLAGYCIVVIYLGVAWMLDARPSLADALGVLMLLAGNVAAAVALAHWILSPESVGGVRLQGVWGIDNPVHASVLLLGGTLPLLSQVLRGNGSRWWLAGLALPLCFVVLAGARTAAAAYLLVLLSISAIWQPRAAAWVLAATLGLGLAAVWLLGSSVTAEVWLARGLSYRDVLWEQVWDAYRQCNTLLGCGIASPMTLEFGGRVGDRAHSIFVAALYHQGLLGLGVFVAALGWLLWRGLRPDMMADAPVRGWAWMLAYVLLANLTSGDHVLVRAALFWPCFWLPVMVVAAMSRENSPPARP